MLEISRPDISSDVIQEFTEKERFIKLPIVPYLQLLPATNPITLETTTVWEQINKPQIALINAINNPKYRFISAALSRRLGKTYIANIIGQLLILVPYCNVLIMSPNYNLSSISFELQRRFIKHFDLELERDNLKDRILELHNGSTVRMGSIAQVDSCVGRSYNLIIFDEAALSSKGEEAFNVALRPTLDRPGSKAMFISTPRGRKNWFTKFYERGFSSEYPEWASIHADYFENSRMLQSDVAEARKSMSRAEFEQEYLASFNVYEGMVFEGFDMDLVIDEIPPLSECEVIAGLDPGYRDPLAFIVLAYHYKTDTFYVIDDYQTAEATTKQHAEKITEMIKKYDIGNIFIDSAAAQFAGDLAYVYDISTTKARKDQLPGIAYMQTIVEQKKLYVKSGCIQTIDMLNMYQWDTSETLQRERPLHNEYSHMADALRYALYTYTR